MTNTSEWQRYYINMREQRDFWRYMAHVGGVIMVMQTVIMLVLMAKVLELI